MRRYLVSLALAVIALPSAAGADVLRVELADDTVTTATRPLLVACDPRVAQLPANVTVDTSSIAITVGTRTVRHSLGRGAGLWWIVAIGPRIVVGLADRSTDRADSIVAIDSKTGALLWRHHTDSYYATDLVGDLLAIEGPDLLEIVDARSGRTVGATPIAGHQISAVCRAGSGDVYLKTQGDLVAIDRATGAVHWTQPTTAPGNAVAVAGTVVDGWVDRRTNRFGVITYDARTGRKLDAIDLGATGGWYDHASVDLAPDGPHEVLVYGSFGVE